VWQPSSGRMWEFWQLKRKEDGWHASWGGAIQHVPRNPGVYGPEAWPGAKPWWGATASSLALAAGVMTIEQLHAGVINHALAIALPQVRAGVFASPARSSRRQSQRALATTLAASLHWGQLLEALRARRLLAQLGPPIVELSQGRVPSRFVRALKEELARTRRQALLLESVRERLQGA